MGRVSGKVAIVSGGARGLGEAFVRRLAGEGAQVVIADVLKEAGEALARELGSQARFESLDVTRADDWSRVVAAAETAFGPVNVLVNNAGVSHSCALENYSDSDYRRVIEINQTGVFFGMRAVVPSMRRAGSGSIINISSTSGLRGVPNSLAYTASKFAVCGMTKVAALELAPHRIRANTIHPGPTESPMTMASDAASAEVIKQVVSAIPMGRMGDPAGLANLMLLLASDELPFATGAEFVVDGGLTCR